MFCNDVMYRTQDFLVLGMMEFFHSYPQYVKFRTDSLTRGVIVFLSYCMTFCWFLLFWKQLNYTWFWFSEMYSTWTCSYCLQTICYSISQSICRLSMNGLFCTWRYCCRSCVLLLGGCFPQPARWWKVAQDPIYHVSLTSILAVIICPHFVEYVDTWLMSPFCALLIERCCSTHQRKMPTTTLYPRSAPEGLPGVRDSALEVK